MIASRTLRTAGLLVAATAVVVAVLPFSITGSDGVLMKTTRSCGSPIVEVTRTHPADAGWYGYVPLTSTPFVTGPGACHTPATRRLAFSTIGLLLAAVLGLLSARVDGGPGSFRRVRWRPHLGPSS